MTRLEALALAIASHNRVLEPGSDAFRNLNPGMLRKYDPKQTDPVDESGYRIFRTLFSGLRALEDNLKKKCLGETRANGFTGKLTSESSLADLLKSFNKTHQVRTILDYVKDATGDKAINENTPCSFFIGDK